MSADEASARRQEGALASDLTLASVFPLRDLDHLEAIYAGAEQGYIYARDGHPNADRLSAALAEREGAEAGWICGSGMGAEAALLLTLLRPGARVVASEALYGKTIALLSKWFAERGVSTTFVNVADAKAVADALAAGASVLWTETLSNPLLQVAPLDRLVEVARRAGAQVVVDATFTPAPVLRPIALGVDYVVHSLTKILSGHGDVTLGAVLGRRVDVDRVREIATTFGFHAGAFDCWLAERGLLTVDLRLRASSDNGLALARWLERQPGVGRVFYPGLSEHAGNDWMASNGSGFGFMLTFELAGGREAVNRLFRSFRRVTFCPSFGDARTTVSHPASTSHRGLAESERIRLGITDGLVRVSLGVESIESILADFEQALQTVRR